MEYINEILKWPVIVQGALGSFLFWLLFKIGELSVKRASLRYSKDKKVGNYAALKWHAEGIQDVGSYAFSGAIYGALHYFIKAIIILVFALMVSNFGNVFYIVGLIISAYFLFRSLSYLPHLNKVGSPENAKKKLEELNKDLGY